MDTYFNNKFNKILSLGSNCYPKFFISKILKPPYGETELFDYIGTSMWSINQILLNDFQDIVNPIHFELYPILENEAPIITNTKYYLRFKHDLHTLTESEGDDFKNKIQRRIDRFKHNMNNNNKILFIRQQESQTNRIPYYKNLRSEEEELENFIDIVHMKYKCKEVTVIYINLESDGWNDKRTILSVKVDTLDYDWTTSHTTIKKLFEDKNITRLL